ncbi:BMP family lipoprotein [Clostridium sp. JNZ J1-5]
MRKRKLVAVLATVAVVASLFAGCGSSNKGTADKGKDQTNQTKKSDVIIGLATDEGGLNDKSFNQAADTGIKKVQSESGVQYKPVESTNKDAYTANLQALALDMKSNLTFAIGYQMEKALTDVAKQAKDSNFAIVDTVVNLPNVQSLVFKEHEGSFLMGVIAAKTTKTGKIGFIGGKEGDLIGKFEAGYVAGARAVNPNIKVDVRYADSFAESAKGYELAKAEYGEGSDIIYHAAGGVGLGLFQATKELRKAGKQVWAIGVDMDQAITVLDENKKPIYADVILTSMIKRVDTATYEASKEIVEGKFKGGTVKVFGLAEEGVGIAPSSRGVIPEDMKGLVKSNVPQDVLALADKYIAAIKEGKIAVPEKPADAKKFTAEPIK